jgi:hypothetical protein
LAFAEERRLKLDPHAHGRIDVLGLLEAVRKPSLDIRQADAGLIDAVEDARTLGAGITYKPGDVADREVTRKRRPHSRRALITTRKPHTARSF